MNHRVTFNRRQAVAAGIGLALAPNLPNALRARQHDEMNQPDGTYLFGEGADLMPTVPVRWRIVSQTAKPADTAPELARTLNFLSPTSTVPIYVENLTTGTSTYVPAHVAASAFGAEGDVQKRWVDADAPAPYVAFELIVADQDNDATIGTGVRLGVTEPFTAPAGTQDLELVALVVNGYADPTRSVPEFDDDYPLIGYVYQQPINVVHADGSSTVVYIGETIELANGDVIEYAGDDERGNASLYFARFVTQRSY